MGPYIPFVTYTPPHTPLFEVGEMKGCQKRVGGSHCAHTNLNCNICFEWTLVGKGGGVGWYFFVHLQNKRRGKRDFEVHMHVLQQHCIFFGGGRGKMIFYCPKKCFHTKQSTKFIFLSLYISLSLSLFLQKYPSPSPRVKMHLQKFNSIFYFQEFK